MLYYYTFPLSTSQAFYHSQALFCTLWIFPMFSTAGRVCASLAIRLGQSMCLILGSLRQSWLLYNGIVLFGNLTHIWSTFRSGYLFPMECPGCMGVNIVQRGLCKPTCRAL